MTSLGTGREYSAGLWSYGTSIHEAFQRHMKMEICTSKILNNKVLVKTVGVYIPSKASNLMLMLAGKTH
jgi:hypothetical protein